MQEQLRATVRCIIWCAVAFAALLLGLTSVLVASSISQMSAQLPWICAVVAGMLLLLAVGMALQAKPQKLLPRMRQRIAHEAKMLRKHVA
jgi:hypothetical protein